MTIGPEPAATSFRLKIAVFFTTMMIHQNPRHHTTVTYATNDEGKSWQRSNIIDLGGVGQATAYLATRISADQGMTWNRIGIG